MSLNCLQHTKHILTPCLCQIFPSVSFSFLSPIFADFTFELAVDTDSLFEISFLQVSLAFLVFALSATSSNAVFTGVSVKIALFLLLPPFCVFLAVP